MRSKTLNSIDIHLVFPSSHNFTPCLLTNKYIPTGQKSISLNSITRDILYFGGDDASKINKSGKHELIESDESWLEYKEKYIVAYSVKSYFTYIERASIPTSETMQTFGCCSGPAATTCKHRKGVIHTDNNNDGDHPKTLTMALEPSYNENYIEAELMKTKVSGEDKDKEAELEAAKHTIRRLQYFDQHRHENRFYSESRSTREYNNNKLGFPAKVTPEDPDNAGYYLNSATTATSSNPYLLAESYGAAGSTSTAARFSRRKLNIFHVSPLLLLLISISLAGKYILPLKFPSNMVVIGFWIWGLGLGFTKISLYIAFILLKNMFLNVQTRRKFDESSGKGTVFSWQDGT